MARVYTDEEIATIHARSVAVLDRIYKTDSRVYKGVRYGKLVDITNEENISSNTAKATANATDIDTNESQIQENLELIRDLQKESLETRKTKADRCYAIAMSIIL